MNVTIYTDGGSRGNPGPAATGVVIQDSRGKVLAEYGEYLGEQTNNFAEYSAIISALVRAKKLGATSADCYLDSKLVVEQMNQNWKVKEPSIQKLFVKAYNAATALGKVTFSHIRREKNTHADSWVNKTLDARE